MPDPMPNRTPQLGDVYRDERGHLGVFIRTETRGGHGVETEAEHGEPEHLFVVAMPEHRHYGTRWFRSAEPLPETLELVVNAGAERRIAELTEEVARLEAERGALTEAMKQAVGVLPMPVANNLRRVYRETRGRLLTKAER